MFEEKMKEDYAVMVKLFMTQPKVFVPAMKKGLTPKDRTKLLDLIEATAVFEDMEYVGVKCSMMQIIPVMALWKRIIPFISKNNQKQAQVRAFIELGLW
jgi:hypothetical protein